MNERIETQREAEQVREPVVEARKLARKLGLDPIPSSTGSSITTR